MSLIDIARSGVLAYRTALGVTGQNITNANTDGYSRRTTNMAEISGAAASPTTQPTVGGGVSVDSVTRAYDAILAANVRATGSALSSAQTQSTAADALEGVLAPSSGGLAPALDSFFGALDTLAQSPADLAARGVVVQQGQALASTMSGLAKGLDGLRTDLGTQADTAVKQANSILSQLATLQSAKMDAGAKDKRDALLSSLGDIVQISVTEDAAGRARVSLGGAQGGPVILQGDKAATLTADTASGALALSARMDGTTTANAPVVGGSLQGIAAALSSVGDAISQIDVLAGKITDQMNAVNAQGLDLSGNPGGALFANDGWKVEASRFNQGSAGVTVTPTTATPVSGPVTLVRDNTAGVWIAKDAGGNVLGQGASAIDIPGAHIAISGMGHEGDVITLTHQTGAAYMRFVMTDPKGIAAAAAQAVSADPANTGTATLSVSGSASTHTTPASLATMFGPTASGATAASFLQPGVVGMIPAGTTFATLASLSQQSTLSFPVTAAQAGSVTQLSFTLGGTTTTVPVSGVTSMAALAAGLNNGTILTSGGQTLASLGIEAVGGTGGLTLASASGNFTAGSVTTGAGAVGGTASPAAAGAGAIQIFTREGKQLAGPPLTAAQAAALLTTANGFAPNAVYDTSYLNATGANAYRGLSLSDAATTGAQTASFGTAGTGPGVATWTGTPPAAVAPATTLSLNLGAAGSDSIAVPQGASAADIAALVSGRGDAVQASASTNVILQAPANGPMAFSLTGDNLTPIPISASVSGGRMDAVAAAVNAVTAQTGISATLSPDGTRMELTSASGQDISLTGVSAGGGSGVTAQAANAAGQGLGSPVTLGAGAADAARFGGMVTLTGSAGFSATIAGGTVTSAPGAYTDSLVTRSVSGAGTTQDFSFTANPALDGATTDPTTLTAVAPSGSYTATVGGLSATVGAGTVSPLDSAHVAAGLASALRAQAPASTLTGTALAALPADGTQATVHLGSQTYTLTMSGGSVQVAGPEAGRLTASFNASNQLVLTAAGGTLDGAGIVPASNGAAFGLAAGTQAVTGQPAAFSGSTTFTVEIGGTSYAIGATGSGGAAAFTVPAGFPGTISANPATGAVTIQANAGAGPIRVPPQASAASLGLATQGAELTVTAGGLRVQSTTGTPPNATVTAGSVAADRMALTNLPNEDLIVAMSGSGPLKLAAGLGAAATPAPSAYTLSVTDANAGAVQLTDAATGSIIGSGTLDANGQVTIGGMTFTLTPGAATGDVFHISANGAGSGDATNARALADLRDMSTTTGQGGFAKIFQGLLTGVGTQVQAVKAQVSTATARSDSARKALSDVSSVNLDTEAANLVQLQQAYQASAQVLNTAKQIFDSLLNAM